MGGLRVYVESNFVLELIRQQEDEVACEHLLGLAATDQISLAIPSLALAEPYFSVTKRREDGKALRALLQPHLRELSRSAPLSDSANRLQVDTESLLIHNSQVEAQRALVVTRRLLKQLRVLPLTAATMRRTLLLQTDYGLQFFDAAMLATVLLDLKHQRLREPGLFISRDDDFAGAGIVTELRAQGCESKQHFSDGLAYIAAALRRAR